MSELLAIKPDDAEYDDQQPQKLTEEQHMAILNDVVHFGSGSEANRTRILRRLGNGYAHLDGLRSINFETPTAQISLKEYQSQHVRNLASLFFKYLKKHWCCSCPGYESHQARETRLSLTSHRRFETHPPSAYHKASAAVEATFQILLSTTSDFLKWQDTEIHVKEAR